MTYAPWTGRLSFPGMPEQASSSPAPSSPNLQVVPLDSSPNQAFQATLSVDGQNLRMGFNVRYNAMAGYWTMTLSDPLTGEGILDSIPLVTGLRPAANLLSQYVHLAIGSAYIVPTQEGQGDFPDETNLGTDFVLVWGDTP